MRQAIGVKVGSRPPLPVRKSFSLKWLPIASFDPPPAAPPGLIPPAPPAMLESEAVDQLARQSKSNAEPTASSRNPTIDGAPDRALYSSRSAS